MLFALIPLAYLLGTFPSAAIVARANGVDIRSVGSGNPGASNVTRTLGWRKGLWVFVLDALKGAIAVAIGLAVDGRPGGYWLGAAAIIGHVFPVWYRFRGGKGVATGGGVFAVLAPFVFVLMVAIWFTVSRLTHKASVASLVVVAAFPPTIGLVKDSGWEALASAGICALVMVRHFDNIRRLANRQEHALS